tara:strand:- start:273 stop:545 length:273 start_codon:yes stop_codon:yes gene_type:complete
MDPKILYQLVKALPEGTKWEDLPELAETSLDDPNKILGGLLGSYLSKLGGDKFNVGVDNIEYSPNEHSSYTMGYSPDNVGNVSIGANWKF